MPNALRGRHAPLSRPLHSDASERLEREWGTRLRPVHSHLDRADLSEKGPWCECKYMKSTSESLSPPETSNGRAAEGNCVAVRWGGEQPEADPQSQTKVNPIRPSTAASLLGNGEACRMSGDRSDRHLSSMVKDRAVGGGWGENAGKVSCGRIESCPGRNPRKRSRTEVRAAIRAMKRGNARRAKGGRKVERPRP